MRWVNCLPSRRFSWPPAEGQTRGRMSVTQGAIQRIDYKRRLLRVIADGRVWEFVVAEDCRLWFNGTPAVLRCFHSLDPVTVFFEEKESGFLAGMIYAWEPAPTVHRD